MNTNIEFLKEFTQELILNSAPAYIKEKINQEELEEKKIKREIEIELKPFIKQEREAFSIPTLLPRPTYTREVEEVEETEEILEKGLYFGKIERMINDPKVTGIECPGPKKIVLVRTAYKTIPTRIMLNQDEINNIIESFSRESRIPRIGGVFKAIVNNLVITAIDSEFTGLRFIISKIHPQQSRFL